LDFSSTLLGKSNTADSHGNKTTTSIYSFSVPKNHFLDKVLFHQMHAPYVPNNAKYSASTFLEGAIAQPLIPETTGPFSAPPILDEDLFSVGSSSHDSLGSFKTVDVEENEELLDSGEDEFLIEPQGLVDEGAVVLPDAHRLLTNWMVAKKAAFVHMERHNSPPTPQIKVETSLLQLLIKHKAPLILYNSINEWAKESASLGHDFTRPFRSRSLVLAELEKRFDFESSKFQPIVISYLPDEWPTTVYMCLPLQMLYIPYLATQS
jgi:hypothetical protein